MVQGWFVTMYIYIWFRDWVYVGFRVYYPDVERSQGL